MNKFDKIIGAAYLTENKIKSAKKEFEKYLNTGKQLSKVDGVEAVWFDYVDDSIIHVVYFYKGVGYDITLKVIDSHTLEIVDFVVAK